MKTDSATESPAAVHFLPSALLSRAVQVDLVGVGGTGSQMLTGLARLHVALRALGHPEGLRVRVWDPDRVSPSNVGRQLFAPSDVGHPKADVLVNRLNGWFGLDWQAVCGRYAPKNGYGPTQRIDFVISCVDTAAARREIAGVLTLLRDACPLYWLDCGNAQQTGQVFLTQPLRAAGSYVVRDDAEEFEAATHQIADRMQARIQQKVALPVLRDVLPEIFDESIPEDDTPSCSLAEALEEQGLYINQHVATWGLTLLERLFREGQLTTCGYWINLLDGRVISVPVPLPQPVKAVKGDRCPKGGTNG